jgi:hypothetical protein
MTNMSRNKSVLSHTVRVLLVLVGLGCAAFVPGRADSLQIPAGSTRSLTPSAPAPAKSKRILQDALTPTTRAKLQAAMDAIPDAT